MADLPDPDSHDAGGGQAPRTPGWVKAFGIIAIVLILLVAFILITGLGGPHGPQRHGAYGDADRHTLSGSEIIAYAA